MGTDEFNAGDNPATDWHPIQGRVEIFLVASCYENPDKLRPGGPLGSYADFTFTLPDKSTYGSFYRPSKAQDTVALNVFCLTLRPCPHYHITT